MPKRNPSFSIQSLEKNSFSSSKPAGRSKNFKKCHLNEFEISNQVNPFYKQFAEVFIPDESQ